MRLAFSETLDTLIPQYAKDKKELDSYKKLCDTENAKIKQLMLESGEDTHEAEGYVAKRIVVTKETLNEERLLMLAKQHNVPIIKTKEYIDMDVLESLMYNGEVSQEFIADLATCRSTTEVIQLRISKAKVKKEDE